MSDFIVPPIDGVEAPERYPLVTVIGPMERVKIPRQRDYVAYRSAYLELVARTVPARGTRLACVPRALRGRNDASPDQVVLLAEA
jgi:hypothetical protein